MGGVESDSKFANEFLSGRQRRHFQCADDADNELLCRARTRSGALALPGTVGSGRSARHKEVRDFAWIVWGGVALDFDLLCGLLFASVKGSFLLESGGRLVPELGPPKLFRSSSHPKSPLEIRTAIDSISKHRGPAHRSQIAPPWTATERDGYAHGEHRVVPGTPRRIHDQRSTPLLLSWPSVFQPKPVSRPSRSGCRAKSPFP